jgi:predicted site-specific integrase-resolvase
MKAKDVLKITGITRNHLYRLVKQDKIKVDSEEIMNEIITLIHCFSLRTLLKAIEVLNASTENKD